MKQAIKLDPKCAHAHALLSWTYASMFNLNSHVPIGELTDGVIDAGAKAVAIDEQAPWGHLVLGIGYARRRRPEEAVAHISKSVALNPILHWATRDLVMRSHAVASRSVAWNR